MSTVGVMLLLVFFGIGSFGFSVKVASLFVVGAVGCGLVFLNLLSSRNGFIEKLSGYSVFGTLFYGLYLAVTVALKIYF
jgi:hypothetical protein